MCEGFSVSLPLSPAHSPVPVQLLTLGQFPGLCQSGGGGEYKGGGGRCCHNCIQRNVECGEFCEVGREGDGNLKLIPTTAPLRCTYQVWCVAVARVLSTEYFSPHMKEVTEQDQKDL